MREGDNIPVIHNNNIYELISNSKVAFINGQYHEAYYLANEAIKLDENCADAYQSVMRIQMIFLSSWTPIMASLTVRLFQ